MIRRAIRPYTQFGLLELPDIYFDIPRTLPKLQNEFAEAQLVFMMGSDLLPRLASWPDVNRLLMTTGLVIGGRNDHSDEDWVADQIQLLPHRPQQWQFVDTIAPEISSTIIRDALRKGYTTKGLLASVRNYARQQWLYVSVAGE